MFVAVVATFPVAYLLATIGESRDPHSGDMHPGGGFIVWMFYGLLAGPVLVVGSLLAVCALVQYWLSQRTQTPLAFPRVATILYGLLLLVAAAGLLADILK